MKLLLVIDFSRRVKLLVQEVINMSLQDKMNVSAKPALKNLKTEVAHELGLANYEQSDKGNMTARENGYVGGYMTKKLVEMAEQQLSGK